MTNTATARFAASLPANSLSGAPKILKMQAAPVKSLKTLGRLSQCILLTQPTQAFAIRNRVSPLPLSFCWDSRVGNQQIAAAK
jgi:hypothetical protein